jgi:uncharacterized SAM-binding protein YcdF (DUF218 family)
VFLLKKFVSFWLMPLPLCLALLVLGLFLARRPARQRAGRALCCLSAALLLLFSNRAVSNRLLRQLEARFEPIPEMAAGAAAPRQVAGCEFVVVLGSGSSLIPGASATGRLSTSGLERIVEAARLLRVLPRARLLVSGPAESGRPSHATVLAQAAESLGVAASRITLIETALDTEDESLAVARMAGRARVALVTSAWHMPRAARLFAAAGVDFVPCPTDFAARRSGDRGWSALVCDSESLETSTLAVHEWFGLLWLRLRRVG